MATAKFPLIATGVPNATIAWKELSQDRSGYASEFSWKRAIVLGGRDIAQCDTRFPPFYFP